ncbi:hypothetical protein RhiirC2_799691 [Rhizophagus irregularis]|uniref:BAH domain-containing protein n=1 Tax=Rhizophagus irregularis TaxID=588596 RepID=A0A2N1M4L8_9GLOM|nr:hypothetical protein RhiirC2_799691 [Rhizophagus irregularis]
MVLVFKKSYNTDDYILLQKCLKKEMEILSQVFEDFVNLPNLNASFHLLKNAKTYATLLNSAVGVKEIVHKIFKGIVPHTNRKNIELDLLKSYTTLFAIRHLIDGGIDPRLSRSSNAFTDLSGNFARIMSDWFIVKECLKDDNGETEELMQAYIYMEFPAALIHKMVFFYEIATYICENNQGYFVKQQLHVGDVVTIQEEIYSESYAIVEAIFSHQGNNEKLYAFVIVNWFEETSQTKLDCPIYRLGWKRWRHIFLIFVIDLVNNIRNFISA